ncbi:hypothetical protein N7492_007484 [Penicillium capsulatum]|uniref:Uncharacterized protein n=1 Tax=Penicillium capsulatum TaxID=69766 RepID=A0A9W9LKW5_9EURO|nr:hypothetical protein N7492_007484 [Penicillium capsulatum]KAJ6117317.1 hypothetical protein N7512_007042 [Penicillium capsulatum]
MTSRKSSRVDRVVQIMKLTATRETLSLASWLVRGRMTHGRRYQALKEDDYWSPSDDQQFEAFEIGHMHILDIGTGKGSWAVDAADRYPDATVRGVDLYPPPISWMPPNCIFEVDDIQNDWTWEEPFDLIHLRQLLGAFTPDGWDSLYRQCFDNLKPGGWIEQVEFDIRVESDDASLPPDSNLAQWGNIFFGCADRAGRSLKTQETMRAAIEKAGFVDVQEVLYKVPLGAWHQDPLLKETGQLHYHHWETGLEGYAVWLLSKFGAPSPWGAEEIQEFVDKTRSELNDPNIHGHEYA